MTASQSVAGLLLAAGGVAILCAMDAVAKALGADLTTFQVVMVRYAGAALWMALYLALTRGAWPKRRNGRRHLLRGALMALTACFFFYGVTHLPLAVVGALAMTAPVYIALFGIVLLKEQPTPALGGAVLLGIAGSLVIVFGGAPVQVTGSSDLLAWGAAVLAPMTYACAIVLLKSHADDESAVSITLAQSAVAALLIAPLALTGPAPTRIDWALVVGIGFLGAIGFQLLIAGLKRLPASVFAIVDYTGLLWAAFYGYVFFREVPGLEVWLGGGLIIAACALGARAARKSAAA